MSATEEAMKRFLAKGGKIKKLPYVGQAKAEWEKMTTEQKRFFAKLKRSGYTTEKALQEAILL